MAKELDHTLIAEIIAGTRRKKRLVNVLKVAENLKRLHDQTKSLEKISPIVDLSPEMIRQFIRLTMLPTEVKQLFREGALSSVDIGYRISKLKEQDQIALATQITSKNLTSDDIRNIVKYKIDNPPTDIGVVIDKVLKSKNVKVYVAYFEINNTLIKQLRLKRNLDQLSTELQNIFRRIIKKEDFYLFSFKKNVITIKVSFEGLRKMRLKAKELRVPLKELAAKLIAGTFLG